MKVLQLVFTTGMVAGVRPVSALVIAKTGSGKSDGVEQFATEPGVLFANDITPHALYSNYGRELYRGNYHHLVIPDFSMALLKPIQVRDTIIGFLNVLIEEGITRALTRDTKFDARILGVKGGMKIHCGIVACISSEFLLRRKERFNEDIGFLSRLLPISYKYSDESVEIITDSFSQRRPSVNGRIPGMELPGIGIVEWPEAYGEVLKDWVRQTKDEADTYGFRRHKQLQALVLASALVAGRKEATHEDLQIVESMLPFFSYRAKVAL